MASRPGKVTRALALITLTTLSLAQSPRHALGQQATEMSTADRLRLLYSTQLNFTSEGDPLIRLGLMEEAETIQITPSEPVRILPSGEGGPEIEVPGDKTLTITRSQARAGKYKHWVVVDRLPVAQRQRAETIKQAWLERGYPTEAFEVGGLFAIKGKVFDSRTILFGVGGTSQMQEAQRIKEKLQARFGIVGGVHSQLVEHPSALLTLRVEGMPVTIHHRDILQLAPRADRDDKIRYKVPGIKKNYVNGTETRTYTGTLIIAPDRKGKLALINSLGAEKVLKGVVPSEIFASAPAEALKAQAIAARNEIFSAIGVRNLADPYMLRADVYDQVYAGVSVEDARTSKAVEQTRGQVMFYGDEIIEAFYSSNAGGFTENNENVWPMEPRPYLRGKADAPEAKVPSAYKDGISPAELPQFLSKGLEAYSKDAPASSSKLFRWKTSVSADKPEKWLKDAGHDIGALRDIKIISRGVSGRIILLKAIGSKGEATVERELNVRRLFGGLRSGLFTMKINRQGDRISSIDFDGAGFGHGVGMCQTGAMGMAAKGLSHTEILTHYYKGVSVRALY